MAAMVMMCCMAEVGSDALLGGFGDDLYVQYIGYGNGRDTINDGVTASFTPGYGGGIDWLYIPNATLDQLILYVTSQMILWISGVADASDGQITERWSASPTWAQGWNLYHWKPRQTQDRAIQSCLGYFGIV